MLDVLAASLDTAHHVLAAPPNPTPEAPPGAKNFQTVLNWVSWSVTALCVAGLMFVAAKMAISHRNGEGYEAMSGLGKVMVACVLVGSASAIVGALT
ncbi:hypothetical protein [Streptomyces canus]|uniref:hypothetical protein n=1 Tax=Streptomyces canus TaxID=58343 RepID=UPI002E2757CB